MLMDFDPEVTAVASQPFWLHWHGEDDKGRRHVPDYFARRHDGSAVAPVESRTLPARDRPAA